MRAAAILVFVAACGSSSSNNATKTTADGGVDAAAPGTCVPCSQQFPTGLTKYTSARKGCICTDDVCNDACNATQCAKTVTPADPGCQTCLDANEDKCVSTVESTCEADPDCTHYVLCHADSKCD
jgi:hypothetical protein